MLPCLFNSLVFGPSLNSRYFLSQVDFSDAFPLYSHYRMCAHGPLSME
jgi:hypothetical protein